jgi:pyrimidine operon attenuation protein/uracil phosphoribosyltransferase
VAAFGTNDDLALVGIRTRGLYLAERLLPMLQHILQKEIPLGILDITLYRDDLSELAGSPIVRPTEIPFTLRGRTVVLVDDVIFTGRTIRAAMDALLDHGRPDRIWLAALADRGGRQLPIQPDFVGMKLDVPLSQRIAVKLKEVDGVDGVFLEPRS